MSINLHDQERVVALAEEFVQMIAKYEDDENVSDVSLDQFMIVGICGITLNDEADEIEVPVLIGSTRRRFSQRGIIEMCLEQLRSTGASIDNE